MQTQLTNYRNRWNKAKLSKKAVFWIALAAAILTIYIGFSWGGWITTNTANRLADMKSQDAVLARLAPICMAQFDQDPQRVEKLDELKVLTTSVQRTRYVKEQAWAVMPGDIEPDDKVAAACAKEIIAVSDTSP